FLNTYGCDGDPIDPIDRSIRGFIAKLKYLAKRSRSYGTHVPIFEDHTRVRL
ncbi:18330_t:CDS:1, partial [Rhizophagus irregularis]